MKPFLGINKEHHSTMGDKKQELDDHWVNEEDQEVFTFKHSAHNFLQEDQDD